MTLSYTETAHVSRGDLLEVLACYPASAESVKVAALKLATSRAIIILAVHGPPCFLDAHLERDLFHGFSVVMGHRF